MSGSDLEEIFHPRSVAVVGVTTRNLRTQVGGINYLKSLLTNGFKGGIYPVNRKGGEIWGMKIYPSVEDIPGAVDYVMSGIPASGTLQLVKDCAAKGVKAMQFFTSGFSEFGEGGEQLEREICAVARNSGMRLIGPNCMGVYCPESGLSFIPDSVTESGPVGLVCQSGGNAIYLVREAAVRGIRFSKVVSYGNACDVDESDLLEYLAADPNTGIILAYIEGTKDGRRSSQALREAARRKPLIVLKAGLSESGARAVTSHTGALAGSDRVWDAFLQQIGAIRVHSLEELLDMVVTFTYLPLPSGRRVGVLGIGGGITVLASDACAAAGLRVPRFPREIGEKAGRFLGNVAGTILNNPIDLSAEAWEVGYSGVLEVLAEYDGTDLSMVHFSLGLISPPAEQHSETWGSLARDVIQAHKVSAKPVVAVIQIPVYGGHYQWMLEAQKDFYEAGVAAYHSIGGAAKAIDRFIRYHEFKLSRPRA
ncbi:MAG: CoA-binding protein [Dehalococcoidia bacterium]|nr:CoA-binding protein [Dehalococcoidia bacterium]